jgi:hypothetical protein
MKMKKIIAREFLILICAIISLLPLFFIWNLIQVNIREKINLIHKEFANTPTTNLDKMQELLDASHDLRYSFLLNVSDGERIMYLSIIVFSIFFLARYLFYAVKWSIIQLKEN